LRPCASGWLPAGPNCYHRDPSVGVCAGRHRSVIARPAAALSVGSVRKRLGICLLGSRLPRSESKAAHLPMFFVMENSRRRVLLPTLGVLFLRVVSAEQISSPPADQMAPPITVRASSSAGGAASEFLTAFISAAVRLDGLKFISCLATAVKLRPDLAGKIVVCALNISR